VIMTRRRALTFRMTSLRRAFVSYTEYFMLECYHYLVRLVK